MGKFIRILFVTGVVLAMTTATSFAQGWRDYTDLTGPEALEEYDQHYSGDWFDAAAGEDGGLTEAEFNDALKGREHELSGFRFNEADTNGDGIVTKDEAKARKAFEMQKGREEYKRAKDAGLTREDVFDRGKDRFGDDSKRDQIIDNAQEDHPKAFNRVKEDALKRPNEARKVRNAGLEHEKASKRLKKDAEARPKAASRLYKDGTKDVRTRKGVKGAYKIADKHPDKAVGARKKIKNNQATSKKIYQGNKGKVYNSSKANRQKVKNNPGKAKAAAKARKNR